MEPRIQFRVRPHYVVLELGPNYIDLLNYLQAAVLEPKKEVQRLVHDIVLYISSKVDAVGHLVDVSLDIADNDEPLSEIVHEFGCNLFEQFQSLGLYEVDGLCFYKFSKFIDKSSILLEYDEKEAENIMQREPMQLETLKPVSNMSNSWPLGSF